MFDGRDYTVRFAITDPNNHRYSSEYWPVVHACKEEAMECAESIVKELTDRLKFGLHFEWVEDGQHSEIYCLDKPGCAQVVAVVRNDGVSKVLWDKRVKG